VEREGLFELERWEEEVAEETALEGSTDKCAGVTG
jgi:hypothetical protein